MCFAVQCGALIPFLQGRGSSFCSPVLLVTVNTRGHSWYKHPNVAAMSKRGVVAGGRCRIEGGQEIGDAIAKHVGQGTQPELVQVLLGYRLLAAWNDAAKCPPFFVSTRNRLLLSTLCTVIFQYESLGRPLADQWREGRRGEAIYPTRSVAIFLSKKTVARRTMRCSSCVFVERLSTRSTKRERGSSRGVTNKFTKHTVGFLDVRNLCFLFVAQRLPRKTKTKKHFNNGHPEVPATAKIAARGGPGMFGFFALLDAPKLPHDSSKTPQDSSPSSRRQVCLIHGVVDLKDVVTGSRAG